ncbi:hypothetical protein [Chamaesiphon sp. VAR_69_metabat_338]|uniref:hypothetical protein n=1 Tax=Chamaesiphon sp. VAR_69_metabat_338 TaxID=2964704 RepID=UPI00286DB9BF|nr:hypothetical protein [Chamaesiphon sp. VAR_69_metabat_338]
MAANNQLVNSIIDLIESLPQAEQNLLTQRLFFDSAVAARLAGEEKTVEKLDYPSVHEIANLAQMGGSFDFLEHEPDLYTLDDGEPVA